jgi:hypothetical protein
LKLAELGRESVCEKCGLQLTIGPAAGSFKEVHLDRDYRRGFQRFYAVLSLGWAATILFVILSGFWEPWYMPIFNGGWSSVDAHSVSGRTPVADTPPSGGSQFGGVPVDPLPQTATEQKPLSVVSSEPLPQTETIDDFLERRHREQRARALGLQRTTMWKWAVGVALLPPLIAYLCLFVIIPWVYRGFTPALHS